MIFSSSQHHNALKVETFFSAFSISASEGTVILCPQDLVRLFLRYCRTAQAPGETMVEVEPHDSDMMFETNVTSDRAWELINGFVRRLSARHASAFLERHPQIAPRETDSPALVHLTH